MLPSSTSDIRLFHVRLLDMRFSSNKVATLFPAQIRQGQYARAIVYMAAVIMSALRRIVYDLFTPSGLSSAIIASHLARQRLSQISCDNPNSRILAFTLASRASDTSARLQAIGV